METIMKMIWLDGSVSEYVLECRLAKSHVLLIRPWDVLLNHVVGVHVEFLESCFFRLT